MTSDAVRPLDEAEIQARARELARTTSPRRAAKALGICRETLLSVAAGLSVHPGTIALVRERLRELDGAQ